MGRTVTGSLSLTVGGLHGCFLKGQLLGMFPRLLEVTGVESRPSGTLGTSPPPPEPVFHLRSDGIEADASGVPFQARHSL